MLYAEPFHAVVGTKSGTALNIIQFDGENVTAYKSSTVNK